MSMSIDQKLSMSLDDVINAASTANEPTPERSGRAKAKAKGKGGGGRQERRQSAPASGQMEIQGNVQQQQPKKKITTKKNQQQHQQTGGPNTQQGGGVELQPAGRSPRARSGGNGRGSRRGGGGSKSPHGPGGRPGVALKPSKQQQQSQQQQAAAAEKSVKSATTIAMATNEAALDQEHTSASTSAWTSARRRKGKNNKAKAGSTSSVGHSGGQESSSRHPAPPATMAIVAATTTAPVTTPKNIATPAFLTQASLTSMASNSTACSPTHHNGHSNSHSNSNGCNGRGGAAGHVNESWREFEEAWNEWDAARSSSPAPAQQTPSKPPSLRDHDGAVSSHWPALPPSTGGAAPRRAPHRVVAGGPAAAPVREAVVQLTAALLKKQSCESSYDALLDTRTRLTDRKGQLQESIRQLKNHGTSTHKLTREALLALASPTDVRAFAARIGEEDKRLDALYRQAATMYHHQQQQGTAGGQNGGVGVSSPPCKGMAPSPAPPSADEIVSGLLRGAPTDEQVRQATKWTTNEIDELDRRISDLQSECATLEVELRDLEHQRYVLQSKADEGLTAHRLSSLISATPAAIAAFMHEIATAKTHLRELAKQATRQETALLHKQQAANRVKETLTSCSCVSCRKAAAVVTFFPCNQRCLCESCWQEWRGRHERAKDEMGRLQAEGMPVPQSVRCYARTLWCPACGKDALRAE
mmetsp:Transcript_23294/g.66754  ORF Transcript_23294/g.66754 Transcript_23294/m.66754 type:complete len:700 (-) Transcript_23294:879-2978(-)